MEHDDEKTRYFSFHFATMRRKVSQQEKKQIEVLDFLNSATPCNMTIGNGHDENE